MGIDRNAFAGQLLDGRFKLLAELSVEQPVSGLFIGQDQTNESNVYIRLLSGPERDFGTFAAAAEGCAHLQDGRIAAVTSYGRTADLVYYVVPFESALGQTRRLHDLVHDGRALAVKRAINIASQVSAALEHAASRQLLHGNLTPRAILLTGGETEEGEQVRLWDFGTSGGSQPNLYAARYSAPERLAGQAGDIRSDIYSLGVIFYQLCTGRLPLVAVTDDLESWRQAHCKGTPRPPQELPPSLADLVMQCLQKDPLKRPQSMGALTQALVRPLRPKAHPSRSATPRPAWRGAAAYGLAAIASLFCLGAGGWAVSAFLLTEPPKPPVPEVERATTPSRPAPQPATGVPPRSRAGAPVPPEPASRPRVPAATPPREAVARVPQAASRPRPEKDTRDTKNPRSVDAKPSVPGSGRRLASTASTAPVSTRREPGIGLKAAPAPLAPEEPTSTPGAGEAPALKSAPQPFNP